MGIDFQSRISALLNEFGMTQAELCRLSGLKSAHISNYCTGTTRPTLDNAKAIADAFGISLDELVGFKPRELTEQEKNLLDMFRDLDDDERREIVNYTEYKHDKKFLRKKSSKEAGEKSKGA